ncbi:MAG: hypothetical protein F6K61_16990 [Sphaerospermopsis sp. SIO1G1]|nr:hypothetical protein [Sphaerospermopsis sp. SIO1G1]
MSSESRIPWPIWAIVTLTAAAIGSHAIHLPGSKESKQLKSQLVQVQQEFDQLRDENQQLKKEIAQFQQSTKESKQLKSQLVQVQQEFGQLRDENQQLKKEIAQFQQLKTKQQDKELPLHKSTAKTTPSNSETRSSSSSTVVRVDKPDIKRPNWITDGFNFIKYDAGYNEHYTLQSDMKFDEINREVSFITEEIKFQ